MRRSGFGMTTVYLAHTDGATRAYLLDVLSRAAEGLSVHEVRLQDLLSMGPEPGQVVVITDGAPHSLQLAATLAQQHQNMVVAALRTEADTRCAPPGVTLLDADPEVDDLRNLLHSARSREALSPAAAQPLLDHLPLMVFLMSADLSLTYINQACHTLLGYTGGELLMEQERFANILHPSDRELVQVRLRENLEHCRNTSLQCRLMHKSGRVLHVMLKTRRAPVSLPGAPPGRAQDIRPGLLGCIVDITGRVLLERSLVQEEKLRTLSAISKEFAHEVRNPLVSIAGFAGRLGRLHPESGEEADIIVQETKRLEQLLERIRGYLVSVHQTRGTCDVDEILRECLVLLSPDLAAKDIWCELSVPPELPKVEADADLLSQTFVHLLLSCINDAHPGTMLQAKLMTGDNTVQVQLRYASTENGAKDPERLLMPFEEGGQGLGVALAYRLIKHMGGLLDFTVEDETSFTMSLPLTTREGDVLLTEHGLPMQENQAAKDIGCTFDDFLKREWQLAKMATRPISLLLVDVDRYSHYVSLYGREHGERALSQVGDALRSVLRRPADVVTALSSQLFAALLPDTNEVGGLIVAENIRHAVTDLEILHESKAETSYLSVSVGMSSVVPSDGTTHLDLLAEASRALHQAKSRGRNRIHSIGLRDDPLPGS